MRGLRFGVDADHPERCARCGLDGQLQRRLRPPHTFWRGADIEVDAVHIVKPWLPQRIMPRCQDFGVEQKGDLLLRIVDESDYRLPRPQPDRFGKVLQRGGPVAASVTVRRFDDHDRVGIERGEDNRQRFDLLVPLHVVAP